MKPPQQAFEFQQMTEVLYLKCSFCNKGEKGKNIKDAQLEKIKGNVGQGQNQFSPDMFVKQTLQYLGQCRRQNKYI